MTATRDDVESYVREAKRKGARYLIIAVDLFDYENYPIFVMEDDDFWDKLPDGENMQGYDEVYDMKMDLHKQLVERRARHPPPRGATDG